MVSRPLARRRRHGISDGDEESMSRDLLVEVGLLEHETDTHCLSLLLPFLVSDIGEEDGNSHSGVGAVDLRESVQPHHVDEENGTAVCPLLLVKRLTDDDV